MPNNIVAVLRPLGALLLVAAAGACAAQSTAEQLSQIENETLLLKAQERQMAVRLQIAQQQADLQSRQAETGRAAQPGRNGDPTIQSVEGIGEKLFATLLMSNGASVEVQAGDTLPNGMQVLAIRANEVLVQSDKRRIRLAASGSVPALTAMPALASPGANSNRNSQFILPPLPPGMLNGAGASASKGGNP